MKRHRAKWDPLGAWQKKQDEADEKLQRKDWAKARFDTHEQAMEVGKALAALGVDVLYPRNGLPAGTRDLHAHISVIKLIDVAEVWLGLPHTRTTPGMWLPGVQHVLATCPPEALEAVWRLSGEDGLQTLVDGVPEALKP
jgi:hypothetical protein